MAVNNEYPILNGVAPSWADVQIKLTPTSGGLIDIKDIAAINGSSVVEVGEQRGASGGRVVQRTTGSVSYEGSLTLYRTGYQKILRELAKTAPARGNQKLVGLVHFQIEVQHTPPGSEEIFQYIMKGCRLMGRTLNGTEGTDPDQVETPLSVIEIADIIDGEEVVML